jgi:hypothetical protein
MVEKTAFVFDRPHDSWFHDAVMNVQWRMEMSLDSHIRTLEQKHTELQARLDEILAHPSANDIEIYELKRQKLLIKDRLNRLKPSDRPH